MTLLATVRGALECALPQDTKCIYLSHPVTTGGRPMDENIARSNRMAAQMRRSQPTIPVVNPTGIGHISGWNHDAWMDLWLPFVRERVDTIVLAPDWETSRGCTMERDCALTAGVRIVQYHIFLNDAQRKDHPTP